MENKSDESSLDEDYNYNSDDRLERLIENIRDNPAIVETTKKKILAMLEDDEF